MQTNLESFKTQAIQSIYQPILFSPKWSSSLIIILGSFIAYKMGHFDSPVKMVRFASVALVIILGLALFVDGMSGILNLIRTDNICIYGLYLLTLLEFLLPQPTFGSTLTVEETSDGLFLIYLSFSGIALGRHWGISKKPVLNLAFVRNADHKTLIKIYWIAFFAGNFYILLGANFDLKYIFNVLIGEAMPNWSRGRYGNWKALLNELGLLRYLIPVLGGYFVANYKKISRLMFFFILVTLLFTLFQAFCGGTRNIWGTYLASFLAVYALTMPKNRPLLIILAVLFTTLFIVGSYYMVEFRQMGLKNYIEMRQEEVESYTYTPTDVRTEQTFFVDFNINAICHLTGILPDDVPYLGSEVFIWTLVKPIPRALWSGKPKGLSVSIEELLGAEGWTIATTYIGEAYMAGGILSVFIISIFWGILSTQWNNFLLRQKSIYGLLLYITGFACALITMRSMLWFTTLMIPVGALYFLIQYLEQSRGMQQSY